MGRSGLGEMFETIFERGSDTTIKYVLITCSECGTPFMVESGLQRSRRNDGKTFWCPNGHGQCYRKDETPEKTIERLQRELAQVAKKNELLETDVSVANNAAAKAERRAATARRATNALKKKLLSGVCPCCDQQFPDIASHLAEKHPDFKPTRANAEENPDE